tara:strand:+ start:1617 stop:2207 length:591 start_codon:yes stop_codon:yes gene_type:complete
MNSQTKELKVKDLMDDATAMGFVIANKSENSADAHREFDPLKADMVMFHPEKNIMLTMHGGLEDEAQSVFMFLNVDSKHSGVELDAMVPNSSFSPEGGSVNSGYIGLKDDVVAGMESINDAGLTGLPIPLDSNVLTFLPIWGDELNPLSMKPAEIAKELHQEFGEKFEKMFDVPEPVIHQVYDRAQEQSQSQSYSR